MTAAFRITWVATRSAATAATTILAITAASQPCRSGVGSHSLTVLLLVGLARDHPDLGLLERPFQMGPTLLTVMMIEPPRVSAQPDIRAIGAIERMADR
jgi:hypothetical protein